MQAEFGRFFSVIRAEPPGRGFEGLPTGFGLGITRPARLRRSDVRGGSRTKVVRLLPVTPFPSITGQHDADHFGPGIGEIGTVTLPSRLWPSPIAVAPDGIIGCHMKAMGVVRPCGRSHCIIAYFRGTCHGRVPTEPVNTTPLITGNRL
jgi:hypothetical protein